MPEGIIHTLIKDIIVWSRCPTVVENTNCNVYSLFSPDVAFKGKGKQKSVEAVDSLFC